MNDQPRRSQKFLVTGAAGFLGSNLVERMLRDEHRVIAVDNFSMGCEQNLDGVLESPLVELLRRDVAVPNAFDDVTLGSVDCIVHLAAFKIPRYGKALDTLRINYAGTECVLELARRLQCKCVIASTSDVYGRNPQLPFNEETSDLVIGSSKSQRWAYAVSKIFDEHLALAYSDTYGFPVSILRFFGSYGPRQHLSWWAGPQAVFIHAVLTGSPVPIHGDGSQTRSFTYVSDTVEGIYQAAIREAANGEIINIGSDREISILELAHLVKRISGTSGELEIKFVPYASFTGRKYEDVMRRLPDVRLCERLLGVRATVPLEEGLARTIAWQREAMRTRPFIMSGE